ncbi:MAG: bifunctional DNA primase/polymerase [Candidatus Aenigmatarchaeota archaeon]
MFKAYHSAGFSVIPVLKGEKRPAISSWTVYCINRPEVSLIELWQSLYDQNQIGIGLCLGPASRVVALDIDDFNLLPYCPTSPVAKRGAKGETRFFQYREDIKSKSIQGLDLLSTGRMTLLPPSIHPQGMPYIWLGPSLLEVSPSGLPILDLGFLSKLSNQEFSLEKEGRNNTLKKIVCAMYSRGEDKEKIINEVIFYDEKNHLPPLFLDRSEFKINSKNKDEFQRAAATIFVENIIKSFSRYVPREVVSLEVKNYEKKYNYTPLPIPREGIIKEFIDASMLLADRPSEILSLGAACALMSYICANRYRFGHTWSNEYILNIAPSGMGKGAPQYLLRHILFDKIRYEVFSYGGYHSSTSFIRDLKSKRERIDIIDEFSSILGAIKKGDFWQNSIKEMMCAVYSASSSKYIAAQYVDPEKDTSSCYNPCVSILGSTTPSLFEANINSELIYSGLLPRFLFFFEFGSRDIKQSEYDSRLISLIARKVERFLYTPKKSEPLGVDQKYDPVDVRPTLDSSTWKLYLEAAHEIADKSNTEKNEAIRVFYSRTKEHFNKLIIFDTVSRELPFADSRAITWAYGVVLTTFQNVKRFFEKFQALSESEVDVWTIRSALEENDGKLYEYEAYRLLSHRGVRHIQNAIEFLIAAKIIKRQITTTGEKILVLLSSNTKTVE